MSAYIHFTEEQIYRANSVNLEHFLRQQGEKLIPSGRDKRLDSDHSVTVRGNAWYDHASDEGGLAIDFVRQVYGLSFPDAVVRLLNGESGTVPEYKEKEASEEQKSFALPPAHSDMRRMFAYLLKGRLLDRDIISAFVKDKLIYESCERMKNKQGEMKEYHNAVFVGFDENGDARHAHKRGLHTAGSYKGNMDSSEPAYSFHYVGDGEKLFVFEAPVDMLSFISLYPKDWQQHSYVALCGVSEHAMLKMLELHPYIHRVVLCLDHDEAGIEAAGRLAEILLSKGYSSVKPLWPEHKDWNEDLKAGHGLPAIPAEEHPQLVLAPIVCDRIADISMSMTEPLNPEKMFADLLRSYRENLRSGRSGQATECLETIAALSMYEAARQYRQMEISVSREERSDMLRARFHPHHNRSKVSSRTDEIASSIQSALALARAEGIRTSEYKQKQADAYMDIALQCAGAIIRTQTDEFKQSQREQAGQSPEITMV